MYDYIYINMVAVNESKFFKHQISDKCIVSLFIIESIYEKKTNYDFGLPVLVYRNGIGTNSSYRHRSVSR